MKNEYFYLRFDGMSRSLSNLRKKKSNAQVMNSRIKLPFDFSDDRLANPSMNFDGDANQSGDKNG